MYTDIYTKNCTTVYMVLHKQTKTKWFQMLVKCFTGESVYVKRDISSSSIFEDITSREHESDS